MKTKSTPPSAAHMAFREALVDVMRAHGANLEAPDLLAVAAHLVGQLVALQDQRTMTPSMAMHLVQVNIERGNGEVIDGLLGATGGHA